MADIEKCGNSECPLKIKCYRHTAPANEYWQAYRTHEPTKVKGKWTCDGYVSNNGYIKQTFQKIPNLL